MKHIKAFNNEEEYTSFTESGQLKLPSVVLTKQQSNIHYNKSMPTGVFVQHIDGTLYTPKDWYNSGISSDNANGVAVITDDYRFVIAKNYVSKARTYWSSDTTSLVDCVTTTDENMAEEDFAGKPNTRAIVTLDTSMAGYSCYNFTFPNGEQGHLPSAGEMFWTLRNYASINTALNCIGGNNTFQKETRYWSSTQYNASTAWGVTMNKYGGIECIAFDKDYDNADIIVWPFLPLNP